MPWATPPCTWPSASIGLIRKPKSSTTVYFTTSVRPVSRIDLDLGEMRAVGIGAAGHDELAGGDQELAPARARGPPRRGASGRRCGRCRRCGRRRPRRRGRRRRPRARPRPAAGSASIITSAAWLIELPCIVTEREPPVPPPLAIRSLSPCTKRIRSNGMPAALVQDLRAARSRGPGRSTGCRRAARPCRPRRRRSSSSRSGRRGSTRCSRRARARAAARPRRSPPCAPGSRRRRPRPAPGRARARSRRRRRVSPDDAAVGELLARDEVPAPQLDRVEPEVARRPVHQPLDDVDRLRPPGAAIGVDRRGVGEDALHVKNAFCTS